MNQEPFAHPIQSLEIDLEARRLASVARGDSSGAVETQPLPKGSHEEMAALRSEVQDLREELGQVMADRDAHRLALQAMYAKTYPEDLEPLDITTLVPRPAGTPDIFEDALAEMERLGYAPL
jgi:hypothetical protein